MNFTVFDTEDNSRELLETGQSGFLKKVTQIAAITDKGQTFYNQGNVIEFLKWLKQTDTGVVYSHNLQYDIGNLFGRALDLPDVLLVPGRIIKSKWQGKLFYDSFNLFPMSLAAIGNAFGLKKLAFDAASKEYVYRDCEILLKALTYVKAKAGFYGIETLPATIGGLSVKIWKALGGENWFDDFELSQQAYYGGRVELFKTHAKGCLKYVDVNSLYPAAMTREFPDHLEAGCDLSGFGIARVRIKVPEDCIVPLPYRTDIAEIWYPYGTFNGTWTMAELQNAIKHGAKVLKVFESYGSKTGSRYYSDFVTQLYAERLASSNNAERLFFKLVLNNLYGQLACSGNVLRSVNLTPWTNSNGYKYGQKRLIATKFPLPLHVNFSHAAYVTSYGRIMLQDFLRAIPPDKLIYTDTDSIIFEHRKGLKLPFEISDALGKMKLEATGSFCQCFAPKSYCFDDTWKAKGVKALNAKTFLTEKTVVEQQPYRFREAVEFYDRANSKQLSVWRNIEKRFCSQYTKKRLAGSRFFPKKVLA